MTALWKCILPFYNHGTHRHTYIAAPDLHINEEMAPDFWRKFTGASCLRQKLANMNAALGFGRNHQHGAATFKSRNRNDKSVGRNVHMSISASCPVTLQYVLNVSVFI